MKVAVINSRTHLAGELHAHGPDARVGDFVRKAGVELDEI